MQPIWTYNKIKHYPTANLVPVGKRNYRAEINNIYSFDIETSNGYMGLRNPADPDSRKIVQRWDAKRYERSARYRHFIKHADPVGTMYVWQFGVEEDNHRESVYMGRTWDELGDFMERLATQIRNNTPHPNKAETVAHVYIHNQGFEFQWLRNLLDRFEVKEVFARSLRKPIRTKIKVLDVTFILHCTHVLMNMSLDNWCKTENLAVKKLKEPDGFYDPIRTSETPLTDEEIAYCMNDVLSVIEGMRKHRASIGSLTEIPMTQTGFVRRQCERHIGTDLAWATNCIYVQANMQKWQYDDLEQLFAGGWTHANAFHADKNVRDVVMRDFASSYPAVMCSRTYPVSEWVECTDTEREALAQLDINDRPYHYYVDAEFFGVSARLNNTFWSSSKITDSDRWTVTDAYGNRYSDEAIVRDNGKIKVAQRVRITMTDLDFERFCRVYNIDDVVVHRCYKSKAEFLPKSFIRVILKRYGEKTSYKELDDKAVEYAAAKQFVNSIYGCAVMKPIADKVEYKNDEWRSYEVTDSDWMEYCGNLMKLFDKKKVWKCWTMYQIGCWVTAWARSNLWDAIEALDERVVYGDTDSVKGMFTDDDLKWFEEYNKKIVALSNRVADYYGLSRDLWSPKTVKGEPKPLGVFADDGYALEFKTLGAKRYCEAEAIPLKEVSPKDKVLYTTKVQGKVGIDDGEYAAVLRVTIAGLPKAAGINKIDSVDEFADGLHWGATDSRKLTSHYNDEQPVVEWVDRYGKKHTSVEQYGLVLTPTSFDMSLSEEFRDLLDSMSPMCELYNF